MIYTKFLALFFLSLLLFSCGDQRKQRKNGDHASDITTQEQRWEEVMALHDDVMPKMSTINRLSRELRALLETGTTFETEVRERIQTTVGQLAKAEEGMWDWMNNLKQLDGLRETMDHTAIMAYIEQEKASITTVRQEMLDAIAAGEQLLEEINPDQPDQKG